VRDRAGIELKPGYFKGLIERVKKVLTSPAEISELKLDAGPLKLGAVIKSSPDARLEIRKLLEPDTSKDPRVNYRSGFRLRSGRMT
jgi:hypothetical protein